MLSRKRRADGRRRAWGRGPIILRFESLEGRHLLAAATSALPDLVGAALSTPGSLAWGGTFQAVGQVLNQGDAAATVPFNVEFFASTVPNVNATSVPLGEATIPAGLAPSQTSPYNQTVTLPPTPIPGYVSGDPLYIVTWVDPEGKVTEDNNRNNTGVGKGYDTTAVTIKSPQPSNLIGSAIGLSTITPTWGQTVSVTAQVRNNAQGDAPETRARLVLTPVGDTTGGPNDFTIGYVNIPAVPAWQTVNVVQPITLPAAPPSSLAGNTQFTLSMIEDSDYVTNPITPHIAAQGPGQDSLAVTINSDANTLPTPTVLPDLAPTNVTAPSTTVFWGYYFQVGATIQNIGQVAAGPFTVQFVLTGSDGALNRNIVLGETTISGLAANSSQQISQTLSLPSALPSGVSINSATIGRVAVIVDPDQAVDESVRSNDVADSNPVTLRVLGTDGTTIVPNLPPIGTSPSLGAAQVAGTLQATSSVTKSSPSALAARGSLHNITPARNTAKAARAASLASARARRLAKKQGQKLHRKAPPPHQSLTSKIEHQLKVFPDNVKNFFKSVVGSGSSNNS
jgi:CARDB